MAIGQLADYGRFVDGEDAKQAVLLPERPREDLLALLASRHVIVIWPDGAGFVDTANGELV